MAAIIQSIESKLSSEIKAFCLKCNKQITVSNPETLETKNHRQRIAGQCPECNKNVSQFIKSAKPAEPTEALKTV
jgi:hypothetical protein